MKIPAWLCLASFWGSLWPAVFAQTERALFDPASLAARLRRMERDVANGRAAEVLTALPEEWRVATPERQYAISTEPLETLLAPDAPQKDLNRELAESWLNRLALNLEGYSSAGRFPPQAPVRLDRILARPEFAGVREPGPWERFWEWINAWIQQGMRELFGLAARHPIASDFLFWALLAAAVGFVGASLLRFWTRNSGLAPAAVGPPLVSNRAAKEWLRAARDAAAAGDVRQAIHCIYWAGISHLEDAALLPNEAACTPRERLRAVDRNAAFFGPLRNLTAALERFWYARGAAAPEDFSESLRQLEKLGCQPD